MAVTDARPPAAVPEPTPARGGPRLGLGPVLVRAVVVLGAGLVVTAAGGASAIPLAALVTGVALAVLQPAAVGAWVALPAAGWTFVAGTDPATAVGPALLAAAGVYLVHTGTAAAAAVPWGARIAPAVARRWLVRCLPAVVVTAVLAVVDAVVGPTPRSTVFAAVAVGLALAGAAALVRLLAGFGDTSERGSA